MEKGCEVQQCTAYIHINTSDVNCTLFPFNPTDKPFASYVFSIKLQVDSRWRHRSLALCTWVMLLAPIFYEANNVVLRFNCNHRVQSFPKSFSSPFQLNGIWCKFLVQVIPFGVLEESFINYVTLKSLQSRSNVSLSSDKPQTPYPQLRYVIYEQEIMSA